MKEEKYEILFHETIEKHIGMHYKYMPYLYVIYSSILSKKCMFLGYHQVLSVYKNFETSAKNVSPSTHILFF